MRHHQLPCCVLGLPFTNSRTRAKAATSKSPSRVLVWKPHKCSPHWAQGQASALCFYSAFLCLRLPPPLPPFVFGLETQIKGPHGPHGEGRAALNFEIRVHLKAPSASVKAGVVWGSPRPPCEIPSLLPGHKHTVTEPQQSEDGGKLHVL